MRGSSRLRDEPAVSSTTIQARSNSRPVSTSRASSTAMPAQDLTGCTYRPPTLKFTSLTLQDSLAARPSVFLSRHPRSCAPAAEALPALAGAPCGLPLSRLAELVLQLPRRRPRPRSDHWTFQSIASNGPLSSHRHRHALQRREVGAFLALGRRRPRWRARCSRRCRGRCRSCPRRRCAGTGSSRRGRRCAPRRWRCAQLALISEKSVFSVGAGLRRRVLLASPSAALAWRSCAPG